MAITERTRPYETLIRHNDDGTIGAHHVTINEVLKDGAVIAATLNTPVPVAEAGLAAVLGEALTTAVAQIENMAAQAAEFTQLLATREAEIADVRAQLLEASEAPAIPQQ